MFENPSPMTVLRYSSAVYSVDVQFDFVLLIFTIISIRVYYQTARNKIPGRLSALSFTVSYARNHVFFRFLDANYWSLYLYPWTIEWLCIIYHHIPAICDFYPIITRCFNVFFFFYNTACNKCYVLFLPASVCKEDAMSVFWSLYKCPLNEKMHPANMRQTLMPTNGVHHLKNKMSNNNNNFKKSVTFAGRITYSWWIVSDSAEWT